MAINVYSVSNALDEVGWRLVSTTYKNLDTELEMECPKGHVQMRTFRDWRKHPTCDRCFAGNTKRVKTAYVPIKPLNTTRILALDAATQVTGYAIYDNKVLVSYGTFKVENSLSTEERINAVKKWLEHALEEWDIDFCGLENIQLQAYGPQQNKFQVATYQVLANLQGVLIDTLFEKCIDHDLVYASEWRNLCGISSGGKDRETKKKQAQEKVLQWYGKKCTQDEADAICIGKYFCNKIKLSNWGEDIE